MRMHEWYPQCNIDILLMEFILIAKKKLFIYKFILSLLKKKLGNNHNECSCGAFNWWVSLSTFILISVGVNLKCINDDAAQEWSK